MSVEVNDRKLAKRFYDETREWQSAMNTLVIDLMFFQRIIDIYGLKITDVVEKRDVEVLKETLKSFLDHRVGGQKNRLKTHEEYLLGIAEDRVLLKDRNMQYKHQDMEKEVQDFRVGGVGLKNSLYQKVEQLKLF
ncbi:MAG: hypothetical protein JKX84_10070 [Flavobacteriales bacterium]|nr:hypothetical protein [Flavobacteriales bacterium]